VRPLSGPVGVLVPGWVELLSGYAVGLVPRLGELLSGSAGVLVPGRVELSPAGRCTPGGAVVRVSRRAGAGASGAVAWAGVLMLG
jgi:hypothetical protein